MRVLNAVRRILLLLLAIPAVAIVVDLLLHAINAQKTNPIVKGIHDFARSFILPQFEDVFARKAKQTEFQDGLVALVALGVLALVIVFVFRALRAMVSSRPPRVRTAPAPAPPAAKKTTADTAPAERSSDETKVTDSGSNKAGSGDEKQSSPTST
jgi:hypothetical protein